MALSPPAAEHTLTSRALATLPQIVNRHPAASASSTAAPSTSSSSTSQQQPTSSTSSSNAPWPYRVGVAEDRNKRWRRTMEDSHAFVYNYGNVHGQGYFSVFDGHAGKHAAEWCGAHFHEYLARSLVDSKGKESVPDVLNRTYHEVDRELGKLAQEQGSSSGCTAVTCFLRLEDGEGRPLAHKETGGIGAAGASAAQVDGGSAIVETASPSSPSSPPLDKRSSGSSSGGGLLSSFARRLRQGSASGGSATGEEGDAAAAAATASKSSSSTSPTPPEAAATSSTSSTSPSSDGLIRLPHTSTTRRVLYTANVGDARAVLSRKGHAVRLTYDHKASDSQEAKRITDAGGFVMNNRVNAVLAVTRSLGDSAMKEFVVGAPYTTETTLTDEDRFLIVACDGLWDVTDDQDAVDLVDGIKDPKEAAKRLLQHALSNFSTDNTSVMVVRFNADGSMAGASAEVDSKSRRGEAAAHGEQESAGSSAGSSEDSLGGGVTITAESA